MNCQILMGHQIIWFTLDAKIMFLMLQIQVSSNFFFLNSNISFLEHYKKDGSYSFFAGKDCSVALAKMSFDPVYLNCANDFSFNQKEQVILDQWFDKFKDKYSIIGKIKY